MMTISPVSGNSTIPPEPSSAEPASGTPAFSDPYAALAALLVNNDHLRSELDQQNLTRAREAERRAMQEEVEAMRDAADAIKYQAYAQGALAVVGGGAQCAANLGKVGNVDPGENATAADKADYLETKALLEGLEKGGAMLGSIAQPVGQLAGGVDKERADADAAGARNAASLAGEAADEAGQHLERVARHTDAVLGLVESVLETEQQGNLAILSRF